MIDIPMQTRPSIDVGSFIQEAGRPSVQAAVKFNALQDMQKGKMGRQAQSRRTFPEQRQQQGQSQRQRMGQNPPPVQNPAAPQSQVSVQRPVQHYEVKAKGGIVLQKGGKQSLSRMVSGSLR